MTTVSRWCLIALVTATAMTGCKGREQKQAAAAPGPPPARIISIVPAVTEMLFAVGAGPRVVAVSSFDHFPPEVESLPKVGGLLDPDIERIIALRPDLLVLDGSQTEVQEKAKAAGIRVFPYKLGGLDNLTRTMRELGTILGTEREAESAAAAIDARFNAIRQRVAGLPRPKTLLVFGREPGAMRAIDVSGGVGFLHDIVELAGGDDVFGGEKREWVRVGVEAIITAAPEVVIELHYGYYLKPARIRAEQAAWKTLPTLPAVRNNRVYLLEGDKYVVPGPRVVEAAEEIAEAIHPRKK